MTEDFHPQLSALLEPQRLLWSDLTDVPDCFVLCGGTAVALHLGHRTSIDFDLFGSEQFDPDSLYESMPFLQGSKVIQKAASTLTCLVDRGEPVKISFLGVPKIKFIEAPVVAPKNALKIASLLDLSGMKAAVVQKRAEAKDYLDIDAMISGQTVDLPTALAAGKILYGASFNPENTLKSLCYFEDGNLSTLPEEVRSRLVAAVKAVKLDCLPDLGHNRNRPQHDPDCDR